MAQFTNPLSRSYSRATLLYFCQKKYFFSYYTQYLSHFDRNFYQECLTLKNLSGLNMRLGEKVHGLLSDYLHEFKKLGDPAKISSSRLQDLKNNFLTELDTEYQKSKLKQYEVYDKENKFGLSEHFYKEDIDQAYDQAKKNLVEVFEKFLSSDLHKQLVSEFSKATQVFVESKIPNYEQMKMTIDRIPELKGIQLWAQPDLGIILPAGESGKKTYIIYDRKSGKERTDPKDFISDQLKVYAYKMLLKIGMENVDKVEIYGYEVFLQSMSIYGGKITRDDIYHIEQKITLDVIHQKQLLAGQNPLKNQPLPSQFFTKTNDAYKCQSCTFRKVCQELTSYEQIPPTTLFT